MRCLYVLLLLLLSGSAGWSRAAESTAWRYETVESLPTASIRTWLAPGHLWTADVSATVKTPDNEAALAFRIDGVPANPAPHGKQINFIHDAPVEKGRKYRINFFYKGTAPGEISCMAARTAPPYSVLGQGALKKLRVTTEWQRETLEFTIDESVDKPVAMPRFMVGRYPEGATFYLGPVTLEQLGAGAADSVIETRASSEIRWTYESIRTLPTPDIRLFLAPGHAWAAEVSTAVKTPDNRAALALRIDTVTENAAAHDKQISFLGNSAADKGQKYRVRFAYKGTTDGEISYSAARYAPPYSLLGPGTGRTLKVTTAWQFESREFVVDDFAAAPLAMPRFFLGRYPAGSTLYLGPVTVERLDGNKHFASLLSGEWRYLAEPSGEKLPVDRIPENAVTVGLVDGGLDIGRREGAFGIGRSAVFFQRFEAPDDGLMTVGMAADWYFACFVNGQPVHDTLRSGNLSRRYAPGDHVFNVPVRKGGNLLAVRVLSGSEGWRFVAGAVPVAVGDPELARLFKPEAGADFRPVDDSRFLEVKPGTALDFSGLVPRPRPAGTLGRLVVGHDGKPVFEKAPDRPVRFFAFNLILAQMWRGRYHEWDHDTIDRFADAVDRRGYNMVRLHIPEKFLMGWDVIAKYRGKMLKDAVIPQTAGEIEALLDKGNLDRFDYLIHAFRQRGIYVNLDMAGGSMFTPTGDVPATPHEESFKARLFYDPACRAHWKAFAEYLMSRVNPYTHTAYRDEPTLALINFINEQDLRFASGLKFLTGPFRKFLREKYGNDAALAEAWGTPFSLDAVPDITEGDLRPGNRRAEDTGTFLIGTMREMTTWFHATLRATGYKGLVNHWDMIMRTLEIPGRALSPVVAQHVYFAHPNRIPPRGLIPKQRGDGIKGNHLADTMVRQESSLDSSYFRAGAAARFFDRPYFNTEYSHCAPNRYRHERGLYFSGYASLQDWDALTAHDTTVRLALDPFLMFDDANDPISRANEALAALIYLRRDVKAAPHSVALELNDRDLFPKHYLAAVGDDYARLALVTRLGLLYSDTKPLEPVGRFSPTLTLTPKDFSPLSVSLWYVTADAKGAGRASELFRLLRERNILAPDNPTDPARKLYVSETGELTLRGEQETMTVATPRLEGAILKKNEPVRIGRLSVRSCSRPASVALAAVDGDKDLASAKRLLLVLSTNAFNTGQVFNTDEQRICYSLGERPALIEAARFELSLEDGRTVSPEMYALHFDGTRDERIPVRRGADGLRLRVDTGALRHGVVFFELVYPEGRAAD